MHNIKRSGEKCAQGAGRSGLSAAVGGYIVDVCACVQQVCSKALRMHSAGNAIFCLVLTAVDGFLLRPPTSYDIVPCHPLLMM